MTKAEAVRLVGVAVAAFPSMQERDMCPTAELWTEMLCDLPFDVAKAALQKVLTLAKFFPTVAEIREAAASLQPGGAPEPEAAWGEVLQQIAKVGYIGTPRWSHPAVGQAADILYGGWSELCRHLNEDSMVADRAHFLRMYGNVAARLREDAKLPPAVREMAASLASRMTVPALPGPSPAGGGSSARATSWRWDRREGLTREPGSEVFGSIEEAERWRRAQPDNQSLELVAVTDSST